MNSGDAIKLIVGAKGDEEKLTLAAIELEISGYPEPRQVRLRDSVFAAAIPHWFNPEILSGILHACSESEAADLCKILESFSFVKRISSRGDLAIHERSRNAILRWMQKQHRAMLLNLSRRAAITFDREESSRSKIESTYHKLVAGRADDLGSLIELTEQFEDRRLVEPLQALAASLEELISEQRITGRAVGIAIGVVSQIQQTYLPIAQLEAKVKMSQLLLRKSGDLINESVGFVHLGNFALTRGNANAALKYFRRALKLQKSFRARSRHDRLQKMHYLTGSYEGIGNAFRAKGDFTAALKSYQDSLRISKRLVALDPRKPAWKRDLTVDYNKIGDLELLKGRLTKALESYHAAMLIRRQVTKTSPKNLVWLRDYSVSLNRVGGVLEELGELSAALKCHMDSWKVGRRLAKKDPKNTEFQHDLVVSFMTIGGVQEKRGLHKVALNFYKKAQAIAHKLAEHDPDVLLWRNELNLIETTINRVRKKSGRRLK